MTIRIIARPQRKGAHTHIDLWLNGALVTHAPIVVRNEEAQPFLERIGAVAQEIVDGITNRTGEPEYHETPAGKVPTLKGLKKAAEAKAGKRWTVLVSETVQHELTVDAEDEDEANEKADQYMHDDDPEGVTHEEVGRDYDIHSTEPKA